MSMLSQKTIACLVYVQNNNDLLLLNRNNPPHVGTYISPGGKVERHERPMEAAEREVKEETGISISEPNLVGMLTETSNTDYNWLTYVYHAETGNRKYSSSEEGELDWYSWDELQSLPQPPATEYVSRLVRENRFFAIDAIFKKTGDSELELARVTDEVSGEVLKDT